MNPYATIEATQGPAHAFSNTRSITVVIFPVDVIARVYYVAIMVRILIDMPENPSAAISGLVDFIQRCLHDDAVAADLAEEAQKAAKISAQVYRTRGDEPAVVHLAGIIAHLMSNREAAMQFWAEALGLRPGYLPSSTALNDLIDEDEVWDSAESYLRITHDGPRKLVEFYTDAARKAFADGRFDDADHMAQRLSALLHVDLPILDDMRHCRDASRQLDRDGSLYEAINLVVTKFGAYWGAMSEKATKLAVAARSETPDRRQLAAIMASAITAVDTEIPQVVELGCFAGLNLDMAARALPLAVRARAQFTGMEPNAAARAVGAGLHPEIRFINGKLADLTAGTIDLPVRMDICLISRVLMILPPDDVARTLAALSTRAVTLIICDDIFNHDGDSPVIRTPPEFVILYPFRQLLDKAGFEIDEVIMAEVPDRECTGFIVAHSRSL